MSNLPYLLIAAAALVAAGFLFHLYRVQRSALSRVLHLISAFSERQYTRRIEPSDRGVAGELERAVNTLAEKLEARAAAAQQDSDHLLSLLAVLDHTNEIALAMDSGDSIRLANPAAARVLGRPAEQLLGRQLDTVVTHPELLALYRNAFRESKPISTHVTLQSPSGGGRTLRCQATAATIYSGSHYRGTLLLLRDITEIARTLQIKTDFVANASHELRTPLASILAAVETVKEASADGLESVDAATTRRCIEIIHSHSLRLEMIITDLLDLSRAEDPGGMVRDDVIDIARLCDQVAGLYAAAASEKHVTIRFDLADNARTVKGDERLLHLTLKNLLDNAIKFTSNGTVTLRSYIEDAELNAQQHEHAMGAMTAAGGVKREITRALVVEVQDTGCGIPVEDQERVFERFYTVNRSRGGADRGTGLGLAIVKHAVAAMGGQVSLHSEPGKGTTLRCHFPITEVKDSKIAPVPAQQPIPSATKNAPASPAAV